MEPSTVPDKRDAIVAHTAVSTILHGILLVMLLAMILIRVPMYQEMLESVGTDLPSATVALFSFTTWCQNNAFLALGIVGLLLAGYAAVYHHARKNYASSWYVLWSGLWYILILLLYLGITIAVEQPLMGLMTSVGG